MANTKGCARKGQTSLELMIVTAMGLAISIGKSGEDPVQWFVCSSLDLPMSFDISKKVQITVFPKTV